MNAATPVRLDRTLAESVCPACATHVRDFRFDEPRRLVYLGPLCSICLANRAYARAA